MTALREPSKEVLRRSHRVGAHVTTITCRGPAASLIREMSALETAERQADAEAAQRDESILADVENRVNDACDLLDVLVDAAFFAEGMHRPARHQWRPWRTGRYWLAHATRTGQCPTPSPAAPASETLHGEPKAVAELRRLVSFARSDDGSVVPRIRELLVQCSDIWEHIATQAQNAETAAAHCLVADDAQRAKLIGPSAELRLLNERESPTALQQRLLDRAVLQCWSLQLLRRRVGPEPWTQRQARTLKTAERREVTTLKNFHRLKDKLPRIEPWRGGPRLFVVNQDDEDRAA